VLRQYQFLLVSSDGNIKWKLILIQKACPTVKSPPSIG
jgi:hypothetical protein